MFIPYSSSTEVRRKSRRAINSFVAVQSAQKRRRTETPFNTEIHTDWLSTVQENPQRDEGRHHPEATSHCQAVQPSMTRPIAVRRFYPMESIHLESQGPFASWALSYFFDKMCPHISGALGHRSSQELYYASVILYWSSNHECILQGLVAWALCTLESQHRTNSTRGTILYHRRKLLAEVQRMLSSHVVDDVLISALSLLISVDDYLGHVEYSRVHLIGLDAVIQARGGYDQLGSSIPAAMSNNIQVSTLVVRSLLLFHALHDEVPLSLQDEDAYPPEHIPQDLPQGFIDLICRGHLSHSSVEMLHNFSVWRNEHQGHDPSVVPIWRYPAPLQKLNAIEKCIFVGLLCLADDTSHITLHPSAIIYRQAEKRADMIRTMPHVWSDPSLADCLVWLWTVTLTPYNTASTLTTVQSELWTKLCLLRDDLYEWESVQSVLRNFFYDEGRALAWQSTWTVVRDSMQNKPIQQSGMYLNWTITP